jgi:hypothetical protein
MCHTVMWPSSSSYGFLLLPSNKTDPFFQGNHLIIKWFVKELDPRPSFISYLNSCDTLFPIHPELWVCENGLPPTRSWFMAQLWSFFPDSQITGQSMHMGGATCLASTGATPTIIQAAGRWASKTFQIYIRKNPILLHALLHSDSDS